MALLKEFKEFVIRGNLVDMAVGVIIGGAFGKIVTSLVNDVIMPIIGLAIGNVDISTLEYKLGEAVEGVEQASIKYGMFLQNILNFIIIAFCIFVFIKIIANMKKKEEEAPAASPAPTNEEVLLTEIRDALNKMSNK
ncbi:large-conductance mechanosensitive channel protein MscL [Fusobacterium gastrosuis]|uniref:large-conductance mechanosensitive channel protein MscL n=2 Tax=Fusobacterium TaxID=848 RepID=UPI002974F5ED|nr:large-conductance mechanosensitive channel protein MscL [Fusobacteriaceae bacterium]MDY5713289.1 large-conductance mechanosensitive channel protein MscL [Fusobacterium gastrosuis]